MTPSNDGAGLLAAVERSPAAAAAHDRTGWVNLFTDDARIEDPVGSRPHVGRAQIGRFYDTFIGPRHITFHRDLDIVSENSVIRDLTLEVTMTDKLTMTIPAILRYDLRDVENRWEIARLRAYWELPTMMAQFVRHGTTSLPAALKLSSGLLRNQRFSGTAGFVSGFRGAGTRGKRLMEDHLATLPDTNCDKLIAAGRTVTAAVTTPSGRGVVFADVGAGEIRDIRHFMRA